MYLYKNEQEKRKKKFNGKTQQLMYVLYACVCGRFFGINVKMTIRICHISFVLPSETQQRHIQQTFPEKCQHRVHRSLSRKKNTQTHAYALIYFIYLAQIRIANAYQLSFWPETKPPFCYLFVKKKNGFCYKRE